MCFSVGVQGTGVGFGWAGPRARDHGVCSTTKHAAVPSPTLCAVRLCARVGDATAYCVWRAPARLGGRCIAPTLCCILRPFFIAGCFGGCRGARNRRRGSLCRTPHMGSRDALCHATRYGSFTLATPCAFGPCRPPSGQAHGIPRMGLKPHAGRQNVINHVENDINRNATRFIAFGLPARGFIPGAWGASARRWPGRIPQRRQKRHPRLRGFSPRHTASCCRTFSA